jgi:hypothetical protein
MAAAVDELAIESGMFAMALGVMVPPPVVPAMLPPLVPGLLPVRASIPEVLGLLFIPVFPTCQHGRYT